MNRQFTTALAIATSAIVGASVVGVSVATASQSSQTPTSKAMAKLEQAKSLISEAELLLAPTPTPTPKPTTTPPPTTSTSTPPPVGGGKDAGTTQNWGVPAAQFSDEFNVAGNVDPSKWYNSAVGCMSGNSGNGKRCPQDAAVDSGGFLRETGEANGNTGWVASKLNQKYGKWEMKMRLSPPVGNGHPYHPVLLLWPQSEQWPQGGEYDYAETDIGDHGVEAFIHHPANTVVQDHYGSPPLDLAQWHTYAISWTPTAISGFIDGIQWFSDTNGNAQAPGGMHATIQLDNNNGGDMMPATMDVDWFHVWTN